MPLPSSCMDLLYGSGIQARIYPSGGGSSLHSLPLVPPSGAYTYKYPAPLCCIPAGYMLSGPVQNPPCPSFPSLLLGLQSLPTGNIPTGTLLLFHTACLCSSRLSSSFRGFWITSDFHPALMFFSFAGIFHHSNFLGAPPPGAGISLHSIPFPFLPGSLWERLYDLSSACCGFLPSTTANFLKLQSYSVINMHSGSCVYDNIQLLLYLQLYFVQFHVLILLPSALSMGLIFF